MTAGLTFFYVLTVCVSIFIAIFAGAAALVLAAWLVNALVYALVTGVGNLIELLAPTSALPRATASFHHGDRP